ncbi:hypothetical protein [Parasphingorhabdus cellanae]|uniref:Uncharacterized protein n=1 Tax=Parasphingorhabdus cellanae TaxID=2806553 RepID=A0ABX7T3X3_9SPHN|nr:hypothetical protein [Parasphingorhabdus cellanae]QTD55638.1 hypothetical protein J4G78_15790 [Parasphingorhabdus cellanae]
MKFGFLTKIATAMTVPFLLFGPGTAAAPPTPEPVPDDLESPVRGYDTARLYQEWSLFVERRQGLATEAVLAELDKIPGKRPADDPFLTFKKGNDLGYFSIGQVVVYCDEKEQWAERENCHYLYRDGYIPYYSVAENGSNLLSSWMQNNFDPHLLTEGLEKRGLTPKTFRGNITQREMFEVLPSPDPILREHVKITRVDSRYCPELRKAVEKIEKQRISWPIDILGVGSDVDPEAPVPHATYYDQTFKILTKKGYVTIEATQFALDKVLQPIQDAANKCLGKMSD